MLRRAPSPYVAPVTTSAGPSAPTQADGWRHAQFGIRTKSLGLAILKDPHRRRSSGRPTGTKPPPVRIWDVVDGAEQYLDEQGLQKPHLAGNSMGGFGALELARRGRASTVCVFSPAGA